jgi:hypothetical protein
MTAAIVAKAILVAGALLLVLGPGMQARLEMREYHDLLEALKRTHDLPGATREYLSVLAIGPSSALHSPIAALKFLLTMSRGWYPRYRSARSAFAVSAGGDDERVVEIRTHLTRARNWAIVVAGSLLILTGAAVELVRVIVTGHSV